MLGWMDRCVPTPGHRPSRWDGHAGLWRPLPGRRQTHSAKAASTTPTLSTWPHCPPPFTRPGHPALCLEDQLALKVTPQPDSWCGSEGPAASRQNPGWNETPEQSSPFLPSFLPPPLTKHLLCQALGILWGPRRHGLCLMGEMVLNQIAQIIT